MGPRLEHVNDHALPALTGQIAPFIIGKGWVCAISAAGLVESKGTAPDLAIEMRIFATELCERLNRDLHLDGSWVVGWTDFSPSDGFPKRLIMAYLDRDGDLIFLVDAEDPFLIMLASVDEYMNQCQAAYDHAHAHVADVGVTETQRIKAALGEESQDPGAEGDWMTDAI